MQSLIRKEYNRGIRTRSVKHRGTQYFHYGKSTKDLVHVWAVWEPSADGSTSFSVVCMNQDFVGGYSDCYPTIGLDEGWCCILVTPESLKKGEAYTVRDGIANAWGDAGGINSHWGLPTGNQYWIGDICYQTFEHGYAAARDAQMIHSEFFAYSDGHVAPAVPDAAAYDHYTDVQVEGEMQTPVVMNPSDLQGDLDGDGAVTVSDVVTLRQIIIAANPNEAQMDCGDLNSDKKLTVNDVVALRQGIVGGGLTAKS